MLIKDLVFKRGASPAMEIAKVVFTNGHWAIIARHESGLISPQLRCGTEQYEITTSLCHEMRYCVSPMELSVTLSELRFTEKKPSVLNPWDHSS